MVSESLSGILLILSLDKVPVIVVGCKLDLREEHLQIILDQVTTPIMQQFWEIKTCIDC